MGIPCLLITVFISKSKTIGDHIPHNGYNHNEVGRTNISFYLTIHPSWWIHCFNRNVKSFIPFISIKGCD